MSVREAIEAGDIDALSELLAPDVVFRSPAVYKPYEGRDTVLALLGIVAQVFENFRYRAEWRDDATTILFFEANVGDRELQVSELDVVSDSELLVKQMRGEYKVKNEALRELSLEAGRVARQLGKVEYRHVLRAHNELADRLVNEALDAE